MTKEKSFVGGDRYQFDFTLLKDGFFQVDTQQDASYYGHWLNPIKRILVSFMEGDLIICRYENDEEMSEDLKSFDEFEREQIGNDKGIKIDIGLRDRENVLKMFANSGLTHYIH